MRRATSRSVYQLREPRLLIVDDDPTLAAFVARVFFDRPSVHRVETAPEARTFAQKNALCAVITRAALASSCGFEPALTVRTMDPTAPVLILSQRPQPAEHRRAFHHGMGYLPATEPLTETVYDVLLWVHRMVRTIDSRRLAALDYAAEALLTPAARDTLFRLADGIALRDLPASVGCGRRGIEERVKQLKQAFSVDSIAQLIDDLDEAGRAALSPPSVDELSRELARLQTDAARRA